MSLRLVPYLVTNGDGKEAVKFYEKALGAEVLALQTFGEMPGDHPIPESAKDRVLHARLKIGEAEIMLSDTNPGDDQYQIGNNVTIAIVTNDVERARAMFAALEEGGKVVMPLQETFWSPAYGQVTDKYGVIFQVSVEM